MSASMLCPQETPVPPERKCPVCGESGAYSVVAQGLYSRWGLVKFERSLCKCERDKEAEKRIAQMKQIAAENKRRELEEIQRLVLKSGMGRRFKSRTFEAFQAPAVDNRIAVEMQKFADSFNTESKTGFWLWSAQPGNGKTHLASAAALRIMENRIPVIFISSERIFEAIRSKYSDSCQREQCDRIEDFYSQMETVPLLIIDDLGKERVTDFMLERLYSLINSRYEDYLPVGITSNLNPSELANHFGRMYGGAIVDRLVEMTGKNMIFSLKAGSYRMR